MTIKEKLTSRKFWAMIVGVAMGIGIAFGLDEGTIGTIAGAATTIVSLMTYIITEGKIDAAAFIADIVIETEIEEMFED